MSRHTAIVCLGPQGEEGSMSTIGASTNRPPSGPSLDALPSTSWKLPKRTAFWLVAVTFGLLLFSAGAPTPLYGVYQAEWHFSPTTLTVIFAIYGLGVLTALVAFGALSDRVGRRPVLAGSIVAIMISMLLFATARSVGWLIVARLLQGLAVGTASTAASAAVIELEPSERPGIGALTAATAPSLGLASGSLVSSLLVDFVPAPTVAVYLALVALFVLALVVVFLMPETAGASGQVAHVWQPRRISVPRELRGRFALLSIGVAASWAVGGFYLSLGPSLAAELLHNRHRTVGGVVVFLLIGLGSFVTLFVSGWRNRRMGYFGSVSMVVGLLLVLYAVSHESTLLFFAGSVVLGSGWGPTYLAGFRSIAALAPPQHKAEILAAVFAVGYLFFSLPAIAVGLVATHSGLHVATLAFGAVVICMGAIAGIGVHAAERAGPAPPPATVPAKRHEPCPAPCTVPHLVDCTR
jgi:MFS family permease